MQHEFTMKMEETIRRATETVDFVSKQEIPKGLWKNCAGVAIITYKEEGLLFSLGEGDGVLIKRNDDGSWGAPSALIYSGSSAGAVAGKADKKLVLFPMTKHGLKMLTAQNKFQLGAQIGLAAGPFGREASFDVDAGGHGVGATFSYVFDDGMFVNIGIANNFIRSVPEHNEAFYGKSATPDEIVLDGVVEIPEGKGVEELHAKLAELSSQ